MRTLIDNTYIRITLPAIHLSCIFELFLRALKFMGRIVVKINHYPNKHPFYYIKEEEQYKLERDQIKARAPWL